MRIFTKLLNFIIKNRILSLEKSINNPFKKQDLVFKNLILKGSSTFFGKRFNFSYIKNIDSFKKNIPIFTYEKIFPYINLILKGNLNIL